MSRHTFVGKTSAADLKKERSNYGLHIIHIGPLILKCRYCSMDFVLLSKLIGVTVAMLLYPMIGLSVECKLCHRLAEFPTIMPIQP